MYSLSLLKKVELQFRIREFEWINFNQKIKMKKKIIIMRKNYIE